MFSTRHLPHALLLLAAAVLLASEPWEKASVRRQAHVDANQGHGGILLLERVDLNTVRVQV